jgi:tetratricopeptide (TPR) repeat protein
MTALTHGRVAQSVDFGLDILAKLNVDIPNSSSDKKTLQLISQTQSMLQEIPDETILSYHILSDSKKIMAMKFLAKLENSLQQVKPTMQPLVTIKMVRYTVEHGITPASAIGFAYFGAVVAKSLCDLRGGHRFVKLALGLLNKFDSTDVAGEVIWAASEVLTFLEPMLAVNEYRNQGEKNALAAGDVHWACINKLLSSICLFWSGAKLSVAKETFTTARRVSTLSIYLSQLLIFGCSLFILFQQFSEGHVHLTSLYYLRTFEQTVSTLIGDGNETTHEQLTQDVIENKNPFQLVIVYFHEMLIGLLFNKVDEMKVGAEKFTELSKMQPSFLLHSYTIQQTFILGLVSFRVYRETRDKLWMDQATECRERVQLWQEQGCAFNFEHLLYMLEAEEYYCLGDLEKAHTSYDTSITSACSHKYLLDEALANELAANFFLSSGNTTKALQYFTNAHEKYNSWGAHGKVNELFTFVQEMFGNLPNVRKAESSNGVQVVDVNEGTRKRRPF